MNTARFGFVLRRSLASRGVLNAKDVVLRDSSSVQKCFSTSRTSQSMFRNLLTVNGLFGKGSPTVIALGMGLSLCGIYTYYKSKTANKMEKAIAIDSNTSARVEIPDAKPTRRIRGTNDNSKIKLTLYQFQSCPFCCKVRAYLDFKALSYDVVEVNSVTMKEIKWSKYKKVPILVCESEGEKFQLNDSSAIISCLETFFGPGENTFKKVIEFYPNFETVNERGKKVLEIPNKYHIMFGKEATSESEEVQKWREWTDNVLVHAISPNIYRTPSESIQTFKYFSEVGEWEETFSWLDRKIIVYVGAVAMFFVSKILKKRHNLSEEVRESLYSACHDWTKHVGSREWEGKFAGGSVPDLADLSVYGVLCAMEGTEAFRDATSNTKIGAWFQAMKHEVESKAGKRIPIGGGSGLEDVNGKVVV